MANASITTLNFQFDLVSLNYQTFLQRKSKNAVLMECNYDTQNQSSWQMQFVKPTSSYVYTVSKINSDFTLKPEISGNTAGNTSVTGIDLNWYWTEANRLDSLVLHKMRAINNDGIKRHKQLWSVDMLCQFHPVSLFLYEICSILC